MGKNKLVPMEPTPEMVRAAEDAHMPFGDMDLAIRMALLAAPDVQAEPVYLYRRLGLDDFVTCDYTRYTELSGKPNLFETKILYTAPQPAEQSVSHDWDDQDKCRRCGDRDWYASATCTPKQQPAPDVTALVEALVTILEHDSPINIVDTATATERDIFDIARAALAAYHKQGGDV